jgi:DNA-binding transcriptional ArsR family regulator
MTVLTTKSADEEIFERQAQICKAFAHPGRLRILDLLGERERSISELQRFLGLSKTSLSQQISILKSAGVVSTRRNGKHIYCSLAIPEVKDACQLIRGVLRAQIAASNRLHQPLGTADEPSNSTNLPAVH